MIKQPDGSWGLPMAFGSTKKKEIPILIGLDEGAGHYVLLVPDSESMIPRSWLSAGQCEVTMTSQNVLRGAGGSDDAGDGWLPPSTPSSQKTKRSRWIPPATPQSLSDGAGRSKGWLPSGTPSRVPSGLCPNASLLAVPSAASSVQAVAAPGGC